MAVPIEEDPGDGGGSGGGGSGGGSGGTSPSVPPATGSVLGVVVTGTNYSFTADQISAAGGPWPSFRVRVTPLNSRGAGTPAEVAYA